MLCHGAKIGFFQGDIRLLMDDLKALQPTVFPVVPRLLNRMFDRVSSKEQWSGGQSPGPGAQDSGLNWASRVPSILLVSRKCALPISKTRMRWPHRATGEDYKRKHVNTLCALEGPIQVEGGRSHYLCCKLFRASVFSSVWWTVTSCPCRLAHKVANCITREL